MIEVRQFDQYGIKLHGSGRVTLRNRKFLRKYTPFVQPRNESNSRDHYQSTNTEYVHQISLKTLLGSKRPQQGGNISPQVRTALDQCQSPSPVRNMSQIPTSLPQSTAQDRPVGGADTPLMEQNDTEGDVNAPPIEVNDAYVLPTPHQQDNETNNINAKKQRTYPQRHRKVPVRFEDYDMKR